MRRTVPPDRVPGTYPGVIDSTTSARHRDGTTTDLRRTDMTDVTTVVNDYIAIWNEGDAERRRELIARTWTEDATYVDPLMAGEGTDGIDAMIAAAQAQYPGTRFELAVEPDAHNDRVRFAWDLVGPDGQAIARGIDFAHLADDGRLREVTGFLEPAAA
jgi:hypothetical protein